VREVGRGNGMEERSLEIGEVLRGGGSRWWRQEAGLHIFWKKVRERRKLLEKTDRTGTVFCTEQYMYTTMDICNKY